MALDVHPGVGQLAGDRGHPARAGRRPRTGSPRPRRRCSRPRRGRVFVVSSSAVVMITWPESPMLPPPIARRSTPRAASSSARTASAPGWFLSWTTNCLAMRPSGPTGIAPILPARTCSHDRPAELRRPSVRLARSAAPTRLPAEVQVHPASDEVGPAGGRCDRAADRERPSAGRHERLGRRLVEHEPGPLPRPLGLVDDRVAKAAGPRGRAAASRSAGRSSGPGRTARTGTA